MLVGSIMIKEISMEAISGVKRKRSEQVSPFQVRILGVPKYTTEPDIYKDIVLPILPQPENSIIGISKQAIKKTAFILFTSEASRKEFVMKFGEMASTLKHNECSITTHVSKPLPKSSFKSLAKITQKSENKQTTETKEVLFESTGNQVLPWQDIPYKEQVNRKIKALQLTLQEFFIQLKELQGVMPNCQYVKFIESNSEKLNEYRNKVELSIGYSSKGEIEIGFIKGKMEVGNIEVDSVMEYPHASNEAKEASRSLLKIIKEYYESDELKPYDRIISTNEEKKFKEEGGKLFWRALQIRQSNRTKEMMITVICTKGILDNELELRLKESLKQTFPLEGKIGELKTVSLNMIQSEAIGMDYDFTDTLEILYGNGYYTEQLLGYSFHVSPLSFLQVNTEVCEHMYTYIKELAYDSVRKPCKELILFDLYCGIGTIGICLEEIVSKIIGIEVVPSAIENANKNAELNSLKGKVQYFCGKADELITQVASQYENNPIIAIVDPPRAGLHKDVLKKIRTCKGLDVVIYVSCNQKSLIKDALYLCQPNKGRIRGPAFTAISYAGADLFPFTPHTECIMLFKRYYPGSICA